MKLSTESRYAINGLSVLARQPPGTVMQVSEIAREAELPAPFLAKILLKLTKYGVLTSHRGRLRGYSLAVAPGEIRVIDVLEAVDGPGVLERCVFWTESCDEHHPCPLHGAWAPIKAQIRDAMVRTTLDVLSGEGGRAVV